MVDSLQSLARLKGIIKYLVLGAKSDSWRLGGERLVIVMKPGVGISRVVLHLNYIMKGGMSDTSSSIHVADHLRSFLMCCSRSLQKGDDG